MVTGIGSLPWACTSKQNSLNHKAKLLTIVVFKAFDFPIRWPEFCIPSFFKIHPDFLRFSSRPFTEEKSNAPCMYAWRRACMVDGNRSKP